MLEKVASPTNTALLGFCNMRMYYYTFPGVVFTHVVQNCHINFFTAVSYNQYQKCQEPITDFNYNTGSF